MAKKTKPKSKRGGARPGAGRPSGSVDFTLAGVDEKKQLAEYARKHIYECIDGLMAIARNIKLSTAARCVAYNSVLDRALGRAPQALHLGDVNGDPLKIEHTFTEFVTVLQSMAKVRAAEVETKTIEHVK